MVRRLFPALAGISVLFLAAFQVSLATNTISVDESKIKLLLSDAQPRVSLAIRNGSPREVAARVTLELLDPLEKVRASAALDRMLAHGETTLLVPFSIPHAESERKGFPWYRLRYRVAAANNDGLAAQGIVSVSEISPDLFELRVVASRNLRAGSTLRSRVQVTTPISHRPVKGVAIDGDLKIDSDIERTLKAKAETGSDGYATLDFDLPPTIENNDEGELRVIARRGAVLQEAKTSLEVKQEPQILLTTDKTLYQPGQTLHLRSLVFDSSRRAIPDSEVTFKVEDPEGTTVFSQSQKTSRFGVASADWQIPANTKLGHYMISLEMDDYDLDYDQRSYVKISRYDLPNFSVSAKPDRAYYLGGQNAAIEVRGEYLFGQPVKRGRVRVVRQTERVWNFKEQKYETEEHDPIEAELDDEGRFIARIDLTKAHEDLADSSYTRMRDLDYAAYLTDATTNRTEQRRFSLRVTKNPIHIYVTEGRFEQADGLPLAFYLSTFYADGSPAKCEVKLTDKKQRRSLVKLKTNRYGVARVNGPVIRDDPENSSRNVALQIIATDGTGLKGELEEDFWKSRSDMTEIRVETDRTIYRDGEPIEVEVVSSKTNLRVFLDASVDNRVVASTSARLRDGRASLSFPYQREFKGALTISATAADIPENDYQGHASGARTIVFPHNRELKLDLRLSKASFQPGDEADASFSLRTAEGRKAQGALGVVVFDKAVEERARIDEEFASNWGFYGAFYNFCYGWGDIGGITARDIEQLDLSRRISPGIEEVADMLFNSGYSNNYYPTVFGGTTYGSDQRAVFNELIAARLQPLSAALLADYEKNGQYPQDANGLIRQLAIAGIAFNDVRDPWDIRLRAESSIEYKNHVLKLFSAGPDKRHATDDDFEFSRFEWPYFRSIGESIDAVVDDYHARTGGYIRDAATLKDEILRQRVEGALIDRWGQPYSFLFDVGSSTYMITIRSGGPNRAFEPPDTYGSDDFTIWTTRTDYFSEKRTAIDAALNRHLREANTFPRDEKSLADVLRKSGLSLRDLRDGWGRQPYVVFRSETRYTDSVTTENRGRNDPSAASRHTNLTPITQTINIVLLRSSGRDGSAGTSDDFNLGYFTSIGTEQSAGDPTARRVQPVTTFSGGTGAITGTLTDPIGAAIPGALVKAKHNFTDIEYEAKSDDNGIYLIRNLPSGSYTLEAAFPGFNNARIVDVQVQSSNLTKVDIQMTVGTVQEVVTVTGTAGLTMQISSASVGEVKAAPSTRRFPLSTPRLREFFPETLVWQPEVTTDDNGRASLRFKFADNITTWKMSVIASTEDGKLGTVEKEIRAFQPFFAELDPPRVLTEGDEISLPVVLRNYLEKTQPVDVEMAKADWFTLLGPSRKRIEVPSADSTRATFDLRAVASITDGKQRITAFGADANDAIEKPVTVHPDGEETSQTDAQLLSDKASLNIQIPSDAIAGSVRSELKIYPNLASHVVESVEAIMQRPYGCGEQTISSAYPSVLVLKHYQRTAGDKSAGKLPRVGERARGYVQAGYERLLTYRADGGGFTYWGRGEPDLALTAYALRFLLDASQVIEVDEGVVKESRAWLAKQQHADGSWSVYDGGSGPYELRRRALNTALIARLLAASEKLSRRNDHMLAKVSAGPDERWRSTIERALKYLSTRIDEIDEPYLIASYVLAAADSGNTQEAVRAADKLRKLALKEGATSYWSLETNTPFYGWGRAGRIETTALAVKALWVACRLEKVGCGSSRNPTSSSPQSQASRSSELIDRGLLFMLRHKDRYGVWYSTQATINVLDTLLDLIDSPTAGDSASASAAEVFVNGRRAGSVVLPASAEPSGPLTLDLTAFVSPGENVFEVRRAGARSPAQAQVVATSYVPWKRGSMTESNINDASRSAAGTLRLVVNFDRTSSEINQELTCHVDASRIGHQGYGMMLAEIGLPPGADVDRASLERAMKESGWSINSYDILPDKLLVYLWPSGGGTKFEFKFRPRFGLKAMSAPSQLYDYYNPDARTVLPPTKFVVR
jgi:hypothetical protein